MSGNSSTHEWKVRSMSKTDSIAAVSAAERANRSTADWIGEAIREKLQREREPVAGEVFPPDVPHIPAERGNGVALTIEQIGRAVEVIEHISRLQERPVPKRSRALMSGT